MTGTLEGNISRWASERGLSVEEYNARRAAGLKWCTGCKDWHPVEVFVRDRSRADGFTAMCRAAKARYKNGIKRDPQKVKARNAVARAVRAGVLPWPNTLPCVDCGHQATDRRHEYDHARGYESENWLVVECVCTLCHADRERARSSP